MIRGTRLLLAAIKKRKFSITEAISIIMSAQPPREWNRDDNEIIVKSNGRTGKQWVRRLKKLGWIIDDYAEALLLSPDFKQTKDVLTKVVFKKHIPSDYICNIKNYAINFDFRNPNPEVTCLICEHFTEKEFHERSLISIVIMHDPINPVGNYNPPGNLCIQVPMTWNGAKKVNAFSLSDRSRLNGWVYAFEEEI
jgi:hypothetical protein